MRIILAAVAALSTIALAPVAHAGQACEQRTSAHVAEHGGLKADSAWHVAHGGLPTCESGQPSESEQRHDRDSDRNNDEDGKSRYCRKHWYC